MTCPACGDTGVLGIGPGALRCPACNPADGDDQRDARGPHVAFLVVAFADPDTTDDEFRADLAAAQAAFAPFEARVVDHFAVVELLANHLASVKRREGAGDAQDATEDPDPDWDIPRPTWTGERLRRRRLAAVKDPVREAFMERRTIEPDGDDTAGTTDHNRKA